MLIQKIAIFILFLGPLVFFHELGHYLFARLFGVRVEVFSIGFGPKILKFKKGFTQYAISLIPLGGYVKMFGDDPLNKDEIPEEDRKFSFTHQGKWARFWIVMGGPLANFILAFFIFMSLLLVGEKVPEIRLGLIPTEAVLYERGLRSGDVIKKINSKDVSNPSDIVLEGKDLIKTITIGRVSGDKQLNLNMTGEDFFEQFIKYPPLLRQPIFVDKRGCYFAISFDKEKPDFSISLEEMGHLNQNRRLFFFEVEKSDAQSMEPPKVIGFSHDKEVDFKNSKELLDDLFQSGFYPVDLIISKINIGSAADGNLKPDDIIIGLNDSKVTSFEALRKTLQETKDKKVIVSVIREGATQRVELVPQVTIQNDKPVKLIGVYSSSKFVKLRFVETKSKGFFTAIASSVSRTWETIVKTLAGFKKLVFGDVSFKSIGGPLAIGKVASDSFNTSISYFFQLMALISVNLGVINLFPIPVLDGGHIMFIFLEIINRGPLSRRRMEIAQQFGLALLLMLMVGAIFNDFSRFF